jgi:hypothetical protein
MGNFRWGELGTSAAILFVVTGLLFGSLTFPQSSLAGQFDLARREVIPGLFVSRWKWGRERPSDAMCGIENARAGDTGDRVSPTGR